MASFSYDLNQQVKTVVLQVANCVFLLYLRGFLVDDSFFAVKKGFSEQAHRIIP
jgi:hypothetical protein